MKKSRIKSVILALIMSVTPVYSVMNYNTTTAEAAQSTYTLNSEVYRYRNSDDAKAGVNHVGTYKPGNYYLFKKAPNGMLNISTKPGVAGSWINPSKNAPMEDTREMTFGEKMYLHIEVPTFKTSKDAYDNVNEYSTYKPGAYYVYKQVLGAVNITKTKGQAGAWVRTNANYMENYDGQIGEVKGDFYLNSDTTVFMNSKDAINNVNGIKVYGKGYYYVFKKVNGAINITKNKGQAGGWIKDPAIVDYTGKMVTLDKAVKVYMNSKDAIAGTNAAKTYYPGIYFVSRTVKGAINISRFPDNFGGWIPFNPNSSPITVLPDDIDGLYGLVKDSYVYKTAEDAKNKKNPVKLYLAGNYFVYKYVDGVFNISNKEGLPGGWIVPEY